MTVKVDLHGLTVQAARPALSQTLTIGASSTQSAAFSVSPYPIGSYSQTPSNVGTPLPNPLTPALTPQQTLHIRCVGTSDSWIVFGANPTASVGGAGCILLPAGVPEYFWVMPGEKIAVIQNSAGGSLNVAEMTA